MLAERFGVAHASVRKAVYGRPPYDRFRDPPPVRPGRPQNRAQLSVEQVRSMRRMRLDGASFVAIAREFKTGRGTVANALHGTNAYEGITDPGPVRTGAGPARRRLTRAVVATTRERAMRGESLWRIAKDLEIPRWLVERAVYGRGTYASFRDPPPLRARTPTERRSFTDEQVRELRRKRIAGAGFAQLQLEAGTSRKTVRDAVYGRGTYRGIWYPYPPETGRDGSYPALGLKEVADMRKAAAAGERTSSIADRFHVHPGTAQRAIYGHVPYHRVAEPPPLVPRRAHHGTTLTGAQVAHARSAFERGVGTELLARELKTSTSTVRSAVFGRGIYEEVRSPPPARPRVEGSRRRLTDAEVHYARVLRKEGWRNEKIATLLGVSTGTLAHAVHGHPPYDRVEGSTPLPATKRTAGAGVETSIVETSSTPIRRNLAHPASGPAMPSGTSRGRGGAMADSQVRDARRLRRKGVALWEVASRFGVSLKTAQAALFGRTPYAGIQDPPPLRPGPRGTTRALADSQVALARQLRRSGATLGAIAGKLGVSDRTVMVAILGRAVYARVRRPPPLSPGPRGGPRALSDEKVRLARRRKRAGTTLRDLAKSLGVAPVTVTAAVLGHSPYGSIRDPPPLVPAQRRPRRLLDRSDVPGARRRRRAGATEDRLVLLYRCSRRSLRQALHGLGPYAGISAPPPLSPERPRRQGRPALSETQVQEARTLRLAGASIASLRARFQVGTNGIYRAILGIPPYDRIRDPGPVRRPARRFTP